MIEFLGGFGSCLFLILTIVWSLFKLGLLSSWKKDVDIVHTKMDILDDKIDISKTEYLKDMELQRAQMSTEFNNALNTLKMMVENLQPQQTSSILRDEQGFRQDYEAQVNKVSDNFPMDNI